MASKHARKKSKSKDSDLIPIIYQVPGGIEIVSGYLEKKSLPDGVKSMRFFGHYECTNCRNRWKSGFAWQGYQLECKKCDIYEWPVKVYHLEIPSDDYVMTKPHLSSLCEKCQTYKVHCLTGEELKPDSEEPHLTKTKNLEDDTDKNEYMVHFAKQLTLDKHDINEYMVHFYKQLTLDKHDIIIELSFIENLFDSLWDILGREGKSEFKEALKITASKWQLRGRDDLARECNRVLKQTVY